MRNVFDQFDRTEYENRLSHALACTLNENRRLLSEFLRRFARSRPPQARRLAVIEQRWPGQPEARAEDLKRRGLPDICIHDGRGWGVLVECKIAASLSAAQLAAHLRTARARGFEQVSGLAILARPHPGRAGDFTVIAWEDVYRWADRQAPRSKWARRLAEYMAIAEAQMIDREHLKEGRLTAFNGIPFGDERPYSYIEAKRLLRLAMSALRTRKALSTELRASLMRPGRPAITDGVYGVWDFIPLDLGGGGATFTASPHLTLSIGRDRAYAHVTIPNGLAAPMRSNLRGLREEKLRDRLAQVTDRVERAIARDPGAAPWVEVRQRRYRSQRAEPINDAVLVFDPRTGRTREPGKGSPKVQPQWLDAAIDAFLNRTSNLQLAIGSSFPYAHSRRVGKPDLLDLIEETWRACAPIIEAAAGHPLRRSRSQR